MFVKEKKIIINHLKYTKHSRVFQQPFFVTLMIVLDNFVTQATLFELVLKNALKKLVFLKKQLHHNERVYYYYKKFVCCFLNHIYVHN